MEPGEREARLSASTRRGRAACLAGAAFVALTPLLGMATEPVSPKQVLVLESLSRDFSPYNTVTSTFRTELAERSGIPIKFVEVSLENLGLDPSAEEPVVDYLRALSARRKPDLVVTSGGPAARFWLQYRDQVLPGVPALVSTVEERHLEGRVLSPNDVALPQRIDLRAALAHILQVLPETRNVIVVIGDSPLERFWVPEIRRSWEPFEGRVQVTFLNDLPFDQVLARTEALPPRSALFFALMLRDAAGITYEHEAAMARLHARANAPIFGWSTAGLGRGLVGGPLIPLKEMGREMAVAAERVLRGEARGAERTRVVTFGAPVYDDRELKRWGIDEGRLPRGSEVRFRSPSFFETYRWQVVAALGVIAGQGLAIGALLVSRRRRRRAEAEALRLRSELAHAGRVSVLGQLASSLAHELNQPLGAILRNAEAAELFLAADPPDLGEVREILADIQKDDQRAGAVIERMRSLLRRRETVTGPVNLAAVVDAVVTLARPDAQARRVRIDVEVPRDLPTVRGDQVHLQQVLLNLIVNGMEAMDGLPVGGRTLTIRARPADGPAVEVAVRDTGPGVPPAELARVFEPFYTTKPSGLGMGLAISRSLVEMQGGRLRAESGADGGATFVVSLPVAGAEA